MQIRNEEMKSKELTLNLRKYNDALWHLEKAKSNILDAKELMLANQGKDWNNDTESYVLNFLDEEANIMKELNDKARTILGNLLKIQIPDISEEFKLKNPSDIIDWMEVNPVEEETEELIKRVITERNRLLEKEAGKLKYKIQSEYVEDARRTFNRIIKEASPQYDMELEEVKDHFSEKWKKDTNVAKNEDMELYQLPRAFSKETADDMLKELYNKERMLQLIKSRGNLSAPGLDDLTNPILKLDYENTGQMLIILMKTIFQSGVAPADWNKARTILLYKGGETNDLRNWRPITITSIVYRIVFCRINQSAHWIHKMNNLNICDKSQKGFIPGKSGCIEHTAIANAIINDAVNNKKTLIIASLDLRDAFGSVPHNLIERNITDMGFPRKVIRIVMNTYRNASIQIQTRKGYSENIPIGKGVKQGYPLSPLLFNIAIDPFLRRLNEHFKELGYEYDNGKTITAQAYADDLLIFSKVNQEMKTIMRAVEDFMDYARILFNPKKCKIILNNPNKEYVEKIALKDEDGNYEEMEILELKDAIKYLGVPLSTRKLAKLKFNNNNISKVKSLVNIISTSGPKISQVIHAIKTYILPKLDYVMANSVMETGKLKGLDLYIRNAIHRLIGGPALSKNIYYLSWKDGGFGLKNMEERYAVMKLNNTAQLFLKSEETRLLADWIMREEIKHRKIEIEEDGSYFFNWKIVNGEGIRGRYHSIMAESYKAANKIQIGIKYIEEENKIKIWDKDTIKMCSLGETARKKSELLNLAHFNHLKQQKTRGQSICTFKNSPISNFYIGNCKAPTNDYLLRFSIRARNDTLWTPAKKAILNNSINPYCNCGNGRYCNVLHILNNCNYYMKGMTERHDKIQNRLVEAIEKHKKIAKEEIKTNKTISINGMNLEEFSKLRPDIHYWTKDLIEGIEIHTLNVLEIAIPFGRSLESTTEDTLKAKRNEKINKYSNMMKHISRNFEEHNTRGRKYVVKFDPIIISSLGAVPNFTINILGTLLECSKSTLNLWAKRLCIDALVGSFGIWMKEISKEIYMN
ncbi:MAG: hypothetical protein Ta2E_10790 [Mycoplasmoidaceae bacterium]|nr:MAG: hypothetical protein Ta2E_10790 [Mycoplasmoidaceae bacterium]